ncbi:MAG: ABC transporter ATP-binding protein [Patescibacteria group bacterium]|nr:ABC transporter ATP-binding protein [Patescibacteria group bacterium]
MIQVIDVSKTYGKKDNLFTALYKIFLEIPTGSTVAIVGKSGSGKSTLMHIMSGLDHASSGEVIINNKSLAEMRDKQIDAFRASEMSFIFQAFFVEANQTCFQNVMLPLEIAKVSRRDRKSKVLAALKAVGLSDKLDSQASKLSGGQKQRLAIARAIVNKPKIIFADEPTGNLDSSTGEVIIKLLFSLNRKLGCTLVVVTHDEDLARHCDIQVKMKDGEIVSTSKTTKEPSVKLRRSRSTKQ